MIKVGEFLLAHDVAKEGLGKHKESQGIELKKQHMLFTKAGSPKLATQLLEELVTSGGRDVETQSLLPVPTKTLRIFDK